MSAFVEHDDLLLVHGTVCGDLVATTWSDLTGITSIDNLHFHHDVGVADNHDLPPALVETLILPLMTGTLTDNAPISVAQWSVPGEEPSVLLDHWRRSLTMFVRP